MQSNNTVLWNLPKKDVLLKMTEVEEYGSGPKK